MTIIEFPRHRDDRLPVVTPEVHVERRPILRALDWQSHIIQECRRHRVFNPRIADFLDTTGLLPRCTFLASERGGGPLLFQFIGRPALDTLGEAWGRAVIGKAETTDPHCAFAAAIARQYAEAIEGGVPVVNDITVTGIGQPFSFQHALIGWQCGPWRAVLSAVQMHDVPGPRALRPLEAGARAA